MTLSHRLQSMPARAHEAVRALRDDGVRSVTNRLVRRVYLRTGAAANPLRLTADELADSASVSWATPQQRPTRGTPLHVVWLSWPPAAGSGGHTTMFRVMQGLADAGHRCTLVLHDPYGGELDRHTVVIRKGWPWYSGEVADLRDGLPPADAYVATSWDTAHALAVRGSIPGRRLYFVQDYEPYFYGMGADYVLAEDSYRFGFTTIAVGRMVAAALRDLHGIDSHIAEYGCDTTVYNLANRGDRTGVAFYAKPDTPRRGFTLGMLALELFHRRHPDHEIHLFGDATGRLPFPATHHGRVPVAELAALYNCCAAGLALSFTNVSLVPLEMMACGSLPVTNDSKWARLDLTNEHVQWARPTPEALAGALSSLVADPTRDTRAAKAAASVVGGNWESAKATVVAAVEDDVYG